MFTDGRSKKIVLVAHCLINQNAVSDGTAAAPGVIPAFLDELGSAQVGILQMPCPELHALGLDRGDNRGGERPVVEENTRIRHALCQPAAHNEIKNLVNSLVFQVEQYRHHGFEILGIIGINRSPSCGVETTSKDNLETEGEGIFIENLRQGLERRGLTIDMIGLKASEIEESLAKLREWRDRNKI